jgi:SNF2 family DNA or RNA helicase
MIPPLLKHQKASVKFLKTRDRVFDTSDAGTGKTPVHITDFASRRRKGSGALLVLCPKSLISCAWGKDFKTFAPDMKVSLAYADNREDAFATDADVYVTNIDAALWLVAKKDKFFAKFEHLIIDESTSVKHGTSKRSRAVAKLRKHFDVRRLLTGTPTSNGICDIHHQMYILDDGAKLGESFFQFRGAVCTPVQVGNHAQAINWVDKPGVEVTVGALIADIVIRNKFEDCVDIPPNHQYAVEYELTPRHRKIYDKLVSDSFILTQDKKKTVSAINGAVLYGKKLQCASGAVYSDGDIDGVGEYALLDTGRYDLVGDLIEQRKHSVVFFNWHHQRDQLLLRAKKEGWSYAVIDGTVTKKGERERIVEAYQAGAYKVLFAHPQSAGHGLTLTRGTTTIFASPTPNLEHFLQAYKRIYRISQTEKTETIMVIAKGTIDEEVWASCQAKGVKQADLLEYLE